MNIPVHVATTHPDQSKDDWVYNGLVSLHLYTLLDVYALYKLAAKDNKTFWLCGKLTPSLWALICWMENTLVAHCFVGRDLIK